MIDDMLEAADKRVAVLEERNRRLEAALRRIEGKFYGIGLTVPESEDDPHPGQIAREALAQIDQSMSTDDGHTDVPPEGVNMDDYDVQEAAEERVEESPLFGMDPNSDATETVSFDSTKELMDDLGLSEPRSDGVDWEYIDITRREGDQCWSVHSQALLWLRDQSSAALGEWNKLQERAGRLEDEVVRLQREKADEGAVEQGDGVDWKMLTEWSLQNDSIYYQLPAKALLWLRDETIRAWQDRREMGGEIALLKAEIARLQRDAEERESDFMGFDSVLLRHARRLKDVEGDIARLQREKADKEPSHKVAPHTHGEFSGQVVQP
jgi:hypothetical protein